MKPLAFRLDAANHSALVELAKEEHSSPGQLARHFVLAALRGGVPGGDAVSSAMPELFAEVDALRFELQALRGALATVLETVLLNTTSATREQVSEWVSGSLRDDAGGAAW